MRIYTFSLGDGSGGIEHHAFAPEVPGAWGTGATPELALGRCRELVRDERAAYERLGKPLAPSAGEQIVDWRTAAVFPAFAEELAPATRGHVERALARLRELDTQIRAFTADLSAERWDAAPAEGWSARRVLDHVASGLWVYGHRLDVWPLDPLEAQRLSLTRLVRRLRSLPQADRARRTEHFGLNRENGRVAWTPRKVVRVVAVLQDGWIAHLRGGGDAPGAADHADAAADGEPLPAAEVDRLEERGNELVELSRGAPAAGAVPLLYRYYRLRLHEWPAGEEKRWTAVHSWFCERVERQSESERALVRLIPNGQLATVRQVLSLAIAHTRDHLAQMRQ
ncbi:MAG: hypothetical protein ACREU4_09305, partial [Burkholderiales bacterium]